MKNIIVKTFLILSLFLLCSLTTQANYGIYYGTNSTYAKSLYSKYDLIIMQDYNYNLFKSYSGKKVCYLSVWEFDGTQTELSNLWLTGAVIWYNSEWGSYIMNMGHEKWVNYLLKRETTLKNMWCHGIFLDTIWQDGYEKQAITLTQKLKTNRKESYIVVNNAHSIKNDIVSYIDAYMFENYWDYGTVSGTPDADWYINLSQEYLTLAKTYNKRIFALSYGNINLNTNMKKRAEIVRNLCKKYNFEIIFSNYNLNKIY